MLIKNIAFKIIAFLIISTLLLPPSDILAQVVTQTNRDNLAPYSVAALINEFDKELSTFKTADKSSMVELAKSRGQSLANNWVALVARKLAAKMIAKAKDKGLDLSDVAKVFADGLRGWEKDTKSSLPAYRRKQLIDAVMAKIESEKVDADKRAARILQGHLRQKLDLQAINRRNDDNIVSARGKLNEPVAYIVTMIAHHPLFRNGWGVEVEPKLEEFADVIVTSPVNGRASIKFRIRPSDKLTKEGKKIPYEVTISTGETNIPLAQVSDESVEGLIKKIGPVIDSLGKEYALAFSGWDAKTGETSKVIEALRGLREKDQSFAETALMALVQTELNGLKVVAVEIGDATKTESIKERIVRMHFTPRFGYDIASIDIWPVHLDEREMGFYSHYNARVLMANGRTEKRVDMRVYGAEDEKRDDDLLGFLEMMIKQTHERLVKELSDVNRFDAIGIKARYALTVEGALETRTDDIYQVTHPTLLTGKSLGPLPASQALAGYFNEIPAKFYCVKKPGIGDGWSLVEIAIESKYNPFLKYLLRIEPFRGEEHSMTDVTSEFSWGEKSVVRADDLTLSDTVRSALKTAIENPLWDLMVKGYSLDRLGYGFTKFSDVKKTFSGLHSREFADVLTGLYLTLKADGQEPYVLFDAKNNRAIYHVGPDGRPAHGIAVTWWELGRDRSWEMKRTFEIATLPRAIKNELERVRDGAGLVERLFHRQEQGVKDFWNNIAPGALTASALEEIPDDRSASAKDIPGLIRQFNLVVGGKYAKNLETASGVRASASGVDAKVVSELFRAICGVSSNMGSLEAIAKTMKVDDVKDLHHIRLADGQAAIRCLSGKALELNDEISAIAGVLSKNAKAYLESLNAANVPVSSLSIALDSAKWKDESIEAAAEQEPAAERIAFILLNLDTILSPKMFRDEISASQNKQLLFEFGDITFRIAKDGDKFLVFIFSGSANANYSLHIDQKGVVTAVNTDERNKIRKYFKLPMIEKARTKSGAAEWAEAERISKAAKSEMAAEIVNFAHQYNIPMNKIEKFAKGCCSSITVLIPLEAVLQAHFKIEVAEAVASGSVTSPRTVGTYPLGRDTTDTAQPKADGGQESRASASGTTNDELYGTLQRELGKHGFGSTDSRFLKGGEKSGLQRWDRLVGSSARNTVSFTLKNNGSLVIKSHQDQERAEFWRELTFGQTGRVSEKSYSATLGRETSDILLKEDEAPLGILVVFEKGLLSYPGAKLVVGEDVIKRYGDDNLPEALISESDASKSKEGVFVKFEASGTTAILETPLQESIERQEAMVKTAKERGFIIGDRGSFRELVERYYTRFFESIKEDGITNPANAELRHYIFINECQSADDVTVSFAKDFITTMSSLAGRQIVKISDISKYFLGEHFIPLLEAAGYELVKGAKFTYVHKDAGTGVSEKGRDNLKAFLDTLDEPVAASVIRLVTNPDIDIAGRVREIKRETFETPQSEEAVVVLEGEAPDSMRAVSGRPQMPLTLRIAVGKSLEGKPFYASAILTVEGASIARPITEDVNNSNTLPDMVESVAKQGMIKAGWLKSTARFSAAGTSEVTEDRKVLEKLLIEKEYRGVPDSSHGTPSEAGVPWVVLINRMGVRTKAHILEVFSSPDVFQARIKTEDGDIGMVDLNRRDLDIIKTLEANGIPSKSLDILKKLLETNTEPGNISNKLAITRKVWDKPEVVFVSTRGGVAHKAHILEVISTSRKELKIRDVIQAKGKVWPGEIDMMSSGIDIKKTLEANEALVKAIKTGSESIMKNRARLSASGTAAILETPLQESIERQMKMVEAAKEKGILKNYGIPYIGEGLITFYRRAIEYVEKNSDKVTTFEDLPVMELTRGIKCNDSNFDGFIRVLRSLCDRQILRDSDIGLPGSGQTIEKEDLILLLNAAGYELLEGTDYTYIHKDATTGYSEGNGRTHYRLSDALKSLDRGLVQSVAALLTGEKTAGRVAHILRMLSNAEFVEVSLIKTPASKGGGYINVAVAKRADEQIEKSKEKSYWVFVEPIGFEGEDTQETKSITEETNNPESLPGLVKSAVETVMARVEWIEPQARYSASGDKAEGAKTGLVALDIVKTTDELSGAMDLVRTQISMSDLEQASAEVVVVKQKDLAMSITGERGVLGVELAQNYQLMEQRLRGEFGGDKGIVEVADSKALIDTVNELRAKGLNVIVLGDDSFVNAIDTSKIDGKVGENYCVISTGILDNADKSLLPFINLHAMALMGVGVLNKNGELFRYAYNAFTGEDPTESVMNDLKDIMSGIFKIIRALPRMIRLDVNNMPAKEALDKLFRAAA